MAEGDSERIARIDERTAHMARRLDSIDAKLDDVAGVQADHAQRITRTESRVSLLAGIGLVFSSIAGWIAGRT
jgi:hypothetical protein